MILEEINSDNNEYYNEREKYWIKKFKDKKLSYNISDGGDGSPGNKLSDEAKRKIGEKNRINMTGKKASLETRMKMSKSQKEFWKNASDEYRKEWGIKCGTPNKGIPKSLETRKKISETLQNNPTTRKYTDEQIKEIRIRKEILNQTCAEISRVMGIDNSYVNAITKYKRWKKIIPTKNDIKNFLNTHT